MPLSGAVVGAPAGVQGLDTDTVLSSQSAGKLRDAGFAFCLRYLSRDLGQQSRDLSADEAERILDAGMALMAVQHVQRAPWRPTIAMRCTS